MITKNKNIKKVENPISDIMTKFSDNIFKTKLKSRNLDGFISKKHWLVILIVELIGTFLLTLLVIAPFALLEGKGEATPILPKNDGFISLWANSKLWISVWVAFGIFLLIVIFGVVSANFNPAVTIIEIFAGNDTVRLGLGKISVQMIGGVLAGFLAWSIADSQGVFIDGKSTLGAATNTEQFWWGLDAFTKAPTQGDWSGWWWIIILITEGVGTFVLCWTVFGTKHAKYKDTLIKQAAYIGIALVAIIWVADTVGSTNINPARALGPALVSDWMGGSETVIEDSMLHVVGQLIAVGAYAGYIQQKGNVKIKL